MALTAGFFYLFAALAVASAVMVIVAKNPVHAVLFLILAFFNAAGLFVLLGAEFLAMLLVIVYVGAVAVLFLCRAQMTERCVFPPGDAKEDWAILRAMSAKVGHTLPYDNLAALRTAMYKAAPALARLNQVASAPSEGVAALAKVTGSMGPEGFVSPIRDFYLTNPIARASAVMAEMSALKKTVQASPRLKAAE